MSMPDQSPLPQVSNDGDLLAAVNQLSDRVQDLTDGLTVSALQSRRTRRLAVALALLLVLVTVGFIVNSNRIESNVSANKETQVQQCENANSVRESSISLWSTVIGFSSVGADLRTKAALAALLDWINELYRQRDCTDLTRVYKVPSPPDISNYLGTRDE